MKAIRKLPFTIKFEGKLVRVRRLELPHLSIPEPKSGASTNSATPALKKCNGLHIGLAHLPYKGGRVNKKLWAWL